MSIEFNQYKIRGPYNDCDLVILEGFVALFDFLLNGKKDEMRVWMDVYAFREDEDTE